MPTQRRSHEFTRFAQARGLHPLEAAIAVHAAELLGNKPPRWMRRAAKAITRRAFAS